MKQIIEAARRAAGSSHRDETGTSRSSRFAPLASAAPSKRASQYFPTQGQPAGGVTPAPFQNMAGSSLIRMEAVCSQEERIESSPQYMHFLTLGRRPDAWKPAGSQTQFHRAPCRENRQNGRR